MIESFAANTTPLCFMPDGKLVCYQHGAVVVYSEKKELLRFSLFQLFKDNKLGRNRTLSRFLRLGLRAAIAIDHKTIVMSKGNKLYDFNINTGELSDGFNCGDGVRALTLSYVSDIKGIDDGVYFGGYVHNFDKKSVNIYYRTGKDAWVVVYTFPEGTINHVHNVVPDSYRQCLWIFTGDFGESAAIWKVSNGFKKVERFVSGDQKWRACVAFAVPEGILYATDAPFAHNQIYLLKLDSTASIITNLPGSCIYGCQWKNNYVFSTTVEADGRDETLLRLLFGWKRGAGIKDRYVHVYVGNLKEGFNEIYKEKKDLWPFIFQFGAIKFPAGVNDSDMLYFQPVATKKNDLRLMVLEDKE